jgi:glycosyltransferase involved in cell wall biosynthesis/SAM-dependent methyltransferase
MEQDFYPAFEERYRGPRETIKTRLAVYLPFVAPLLRPYPSAPAVDLGCGRGEWLEILREAGFHPLGVDRDEGMLQACRRQNLDVRQKEIGAFLAGVPDASQVVVSAFHVVEHLEFEELRALVNEAWRILKPGGVLIMETPNPENLHIATCYFYQDPTHRRPVSPVLLEFVAEYAGFGRRKLLRLQEDRALADENRRVHLRDVLFGVSPDYAVVAQKEAPPEILALLDAPFERAYGLDMEALLARRERHRAGTAEKLENRLRAAEARIQEAEARTREAAAQARDAAAQARETEARAQKAVAWARETEAQAREAAARAQEAMDSARRAGDEARQWQEQVRLLHASTSWRITRPLRALKHLAGGDFSPLRRIASGTRRRARDGVNAASRYVLHRPALRRLLVRAVKSSPRLRHFLLRTVDKFDAPAGPDLSPRAARIYRALTVAAAAREAAADRLPPSPARPRLAYVSPLPPETSGIGFYSAELLPALREWYEIEVIVVHPEVADAWIREHCPIRTVEWFCAHAARFDRVLYHFGNSPFHQHMFDLLEEIPGVVVLHDFFLSNIQVRRALFGATHAWERALCASHGYHAVADPTPIDDKVVHYPANLPVLQAAQGVIVHSEYARRLASRWYGNAAGQDWTMLPHLRVPAQARPEARAASREALGIAADAFLVCAFGYMGLTKLNDRLIDAWLASPLAEDARALLVFVGERDQGNYGHKIATMITRGAGRIRITGWADTELFQRYLWAADVGVQLRVLSRGETSGTVLDCMNHGLATIVNAHGSLADLDTDALWMLPDEFCDRELIDALFTLRRDAGRRARLGDAARAVIAARHAPEACARQYAEAIERYATAPSWTASLPTAREETDLMALAGALARDFPPAPRRRQLLVDVSAIARVDLKTGIQRVVRAVLGEWLSYDESWQVEPVCAAPEGYRYARRFACDFLGVAKDWAEDALVDAWPGDVFFGLDFHNTTVPDHRELLEKWRDAGVHVGFLVYDLLPVAHPEFFPAGGAQIHQRWLETVAALDFAACISRSTAQALADWLAEFGPLRTPPLRIEWFHIGADLAASAPTSGLPSDAAACLDALRARPSFLMVGTVEPRKGHADALDAFDALWQEGVDVNLVIVGKEGWQVEALAGRLRARAEREPRLLWLENASDEYLEHLYGAAAALIAASCAEGFGLPLIEAARHKLPVIARDIPVFREVAGEHAYYFDDLAPALKTWLELFRQARHPVSDGMPWCTWQESARRLWCLVTGETDRH